MPQEKRIIWGVRPCDARSLTILDRVFINKDYEDPYYSHRRKNTVVISLVCQKPGLGCFCKDPLTTEGSDLMLLDCGDTYLVKLVSVKGKGLIKNPVFTADKPINIPMELPANPFNLEIADKDLAEKLEVIYRSPLWRELQEKCVNCGVCTFLCPTCHCFDLTDDQKGKKFAVGILVCLPVLLNKPPDIIPVLQGQNDCASGLCINLDIFSKIMVFLPVLDVDVVWRNAP